MDNLINIALFNTMLGLMNYSDNSKEQALLENIKETMDDISKQLNNIRLNQLGG